MTPNGYPIREALDDVRKTFEAVAPSSTTSSMPLKSRLARKACRTVWMTKVGWRSAPSQVSLILDSDKVETVLRAAIDQRQSG